eukprot:CAMPEP_0179903790 /NCGR_PEP_ID=MMETSP0982-20121206/41497_1 /TAXON_ID=483367 /ORGANISM="non described non described, Strain CCMP 2436" /LENGTH=50 /DNA_ID=CAMNT_0021803451 /DNA_START=719 /DNA_END=868 /DNA_ORIENTATION=-
MCTLDVGAAMICTSTPSFTSRHTRPTRRSPPAVAELLRLSADEASISAEL